MSSSVPAAVNGLTTLMKAVLPQEILVRVGGPPLYAWSSPITFSVLGVMGFSDPAELGINYKREEKYSIMCEISSYEGDQEFLSRWDEVLNTWAIVTVAIANDPHLTGVPNSPNVNGPVRFAQYTDYMLHADANTPGQSIGRLTFNVNCEQRVESLT